MRRHFLIIAVLLSLGRPAFSQDPGVFPKDFCATLPALSADDQQRLWQKMPDLNGAPSRLVPADTATALLARAAARNLSALQLFTEDAVREDCAFVLTGDVIDRLDRSFDMFVLTPFSGTATDGQAFRTTVFVFGRGRLFHFYDRGGFSYKHPYFNDTFMYDNVIREHSPEYGRLDLVGVHGPLGLSIDSVRMSSPETAEVRAGVIQVSRPLRKIARKSPLLVHALRLPTPGRVKTWFESR